MTFNANSTHAAQTASQAIAVCVEQLAREAKAASKDLAFTSNEERICAVKTMAQYLRDNSASIIEANAADMKAAVEHGTSAGLLDRLELNEARIESMAVGLEELCELPDSCGRVLEEREIACGLHMKRVSVPLGLVAVIYEARPNVTSDAAGICIRTGNGCILRGGSLARHSCAAIAHVLSDALEACGIDGRAISIIDVAGHEATDALMKLHGIVDVLIPRGGAGLIRHCVEHATVPVIETGTGNCHIYIHESANIEQAINIVLNAKTQRTGVCNACESLLLDESIALSVAPRLIDALVAAGVTVHAQQDLIANNASDLVVAATSEDWGTEYLSMDISLKTVSGVDEAIEHINRYGTGHSEAIMATDPDAIERFCNRVDAAAVYANASTRFTDGGQFGLGAEIGISTQKLHVRGPFAADALTSYKYIISGEGQIRP